MIDWQKRAEAAEAKLVSVTESRDQWKANAHEFSRCADRLEAKLAELEKQEPYGYVHNVCNPPGSGVAASIFKEENRHYGRPVFTRPAPAVSLAELVPDEFTTDEVPCAMTDVIQAQMDGWNACRVDILRNIEEAK